MTTELHWNVDPVIFAWRGFSLHWYGVLFAGAFLLGFRVMRRIYVHERRPVQELDTLLLQIMAGTVIGARLAHCFFYEPEYYWAHPVEVLKVWRGGLASHGGAIGVLIAVGWFCRQRDRPNFFWMLDRLAMAAVVAGAIIRIGNFFNSEIVGKPASFFGIVFDRVDQFPRHPVQLYESMAYGIIFAVLWWLYRTKRPQTGVLTGLYLSLVFSARFVLEYFKEPQAAYEQGFAITVGQWLSVPFIVCGIALLCFRRRIAATTTSDS